MNAITNPTQLSQIANHFNGASILRAEQWEAVGFAVIKGLGARFFSLKVLEKKRWKSK